MPFLKLFGACRAMSAVDNTPGAGPGTRPAEASPAALPASADPPAPAGPAAAAEPASAEPAVAEGTSSTSAAGDAASSASAPVDPVKALVTSAIKKAVENAPSEQSGQAQTIAITAAQAQALGFFNRLMFDGPEHVSPAVLAKMNPENFEEELREMMEARLGDQVSNIPLEGLAGALLPVCEQMQALRPRVLASEAAAQSAAASRGGEAGTSNEGAASSGAAARPRLPARAPRVGAGGAAAAGAVSGRAAAAEWDNIYGPDEPADVRKFRETLQQVRVDTCRAFIKSGIGLTSVNLRHTMMRLRTAEQQAAAFSRRPNVEELARVTAQRLEAGAAPFAQRLVVAVIGIRGAGKTALIRKLLGLGPLDPFSGGTRRVQVVDGVARGMPARFIDTPGLDIGFDAQQSNRSTMLQLRNVLRKKGNKPHVFLFVDRMDESRSQEVDAGLLAAAYQVLGRGQIYHTIGVLTHAACKPPDTKAGALEYEAWSTPRTRALQFTMMVTSGDRTAQHFTALAENHPACRVVEGEPVLPNGTRWAPHLLDIMLMFLGLRMGMDVPRPKKKKVKGAPAQQRGMDIRRLLGGAGEKAVPVTYILQQYNQAKAVHKLPDEERAILTPGEIRALKEEQHEQAREEQRRRREYMKLREEEARNPEPIVPTLAPDPPLPPVFEAQQHTYRYRYNENQAGWIARPFVDSNGPDRSDGINGGQAERSGTLRLPQQYIGGAPARVLFQSVKDKESMVLVCNAESSASIGRDNVVTTSLESQTLSGDAIYTLRVEPRFKYLEINGRKRLKTAIGLLNTRIAEEYDPRKGPVAKGIRLEQRVRVSDGLKIIGSHVGMVGATPSSKERGRAWGLEATYKPKGSIEGRELMAGWNMMGTERLSSQGQARGGHRIHGGTLAMVQHLTPETMLNSRVQMSSNGQSTLSVRVTSHDKMSMRWAYLMPVVGWLIDKVSKRSNEPADF